MGGEIWAEGVVEGEIGKGRRGSSTSVGRGWAKSAGTRRRGGKREM